ncbi:hypothetical protein RCL1_000385 [Eukaryota sp. TZLM3-RCL]
MLRTSHFESPYAPLPRHGEVVAGVLSLFYWSLQTIDTFLRPFCFLPKRLNVFLRKRENLYLNRSDKVKKHKFLTDFNNVRDLVIRGQKFKTKYFTIHLQNIESWLHTDDINDPRTKNSFIQHLKVLDLPKGSVKGVYSLKSKIGTVNYIAFISRSIYLMKNIQEISDYLKSVNSSKPFKPLMIYNAIPLRTSSVPAHFQYDTKGIHTVITVSGIKEERFNQNDDKKVWLTVIKPHFVTHENAHVLGESNQNVSMHELQLQQATDNSTITNSKWASTFCFDYCVFNNKYWFE